MLIFWVLLMNSKLNKILIADDEEDLTWSISKSLIKDNDLLEITCVNSGDEALKVLETISIDLIITDIRMPGKNGLEILDQIEKNYPHTKMIIMTAYGSPAIQEKVRNTKNAYYVEKPFDIHELKELIFNIKWNNKELKTSLNDECLDMFLN